ncbi:pentatricopeptide repeat-containing protein At4g39952, mitochondrial isoform X2 [Momordica charantia]|uniref:Pentatricopeptide repeat-containing protein At4g39952, mitochondrial isoform X2 n=1 Tax=Momordica charantia TaxID=3673 RepID=A0A6J1DLD5_MOMCH|nr:pentatricopeptide repeat-containing protein At4g39952, mitochondrial isoform X2 [Momordica charantia]
MLRLRPSQFHIRFSSSSPFSSLLDPCYLNSCFHIFLSKQFLAFKSLLQFHSLIITTGNSKNVFFATKLMSFYASHRQPALSTHLFHSIHPKDGFLWNSIIQSHFSNGDYLQAFGFYLQMRASSSLPNQFTVPMVLSTCAELMMLNHGMNIHGYGGAPNYRTLGSGFQACVDLDALVEGRCLHGLALKTGILCFEVIKSCLLSMYSRCGSPEEAYRCFCKLNKKDLISWTSIIAVHAKFGLMTECLSLFWEMQADEIIPDEIAISCMVLGFGNSDRTSEGKAFHGWILRQCYAVSEITHNALLSMYCKFGLLNTTEKIFHSFHKSSKEDWNTMISGYSNMGQKEKCIDLFRDMQLLGIGPDLISLASVISSCSQVGAVNIGRSIHCYAIKNSIIENVSIANSLLDMYGKSGNLTTAWRIFHRTQQRDIISWNTLISSYKQSGHPAEAIVLFDEMIKNNLKPNAITCVIVLSACAHLASLDKGERIHQYIRENGYGTDITIRTSLIDMYAKCGELETSRKLFNAVEERDVILWNVMISSYGMHGHAESAIEIFELMEESNVKPNSLTFLSLLSACNHGGLVEEGRRLFDRMQKYGVKVSLKHYASMVDLLGRSGSLQEAETLVLSMPISPDGTVWGSLLSACKLHNEFEMGVRIARHAIESDPENDGYYIILSDLYGCLGRWEEVERVRVIMKERGVEKRTGWSAL